MRDVSDAALTSRVQHLVPWVHDVVRRASDMEECRLTFRYTRQSAPPYM